MNTNLIIAVITGIATAIPLVIKLIEYVQKAVKEKNWTRLLELVFAAMAVAEDKFETGAERKEWVLAVVQSSAETINYPVDTAALSLLIDTICDLTKRVNYTATDEV